MRKRNTAFCLRAVGAYFYQLRPGSGNTRQCSIRNTLLVSHALVSAASKDVFEVYFAIHNIESAGELLVHTSRSSGYGKEAPVQYLKFCLSALSLF